MLSINKRIPYKYLHNRATTDRRISSEDGTMRSVSIKTFFYDGLFLPKRESQFIRRGSYDFFFFFSFFSTTAIPPVIFFFFPPVVLTRFLAQTGSGRGRARAGEEEEWLNPRERDQRKNYQGSKRGPGFGPVGDLPHVNKDRASVAWCCPA